MGAPAPGDEELIDDATAAARRMTATIAGATFAVLHLAAGLLTLALATAVPLAVGVGLGVLWLVLARVGWRARSRFPLATMLLPMGHAGLVLIVLATASRGG